MIEDNVECCLEICIRQNCNDGYQFDELCKDNVIVKRQ